MKMSIFLKQLYMFLCLFFLTLQTKAQTIEWEQTNGPEDGPIWSIAINKYGELFAGSDGGIFRYSLENGWSQTNALWQSTKVVSIVSNNENQLFAGTWGLWIL